MGLVAERLNLRLFIDGIEVPVIGAKCTFAEATVATAEIQVIATDQIYDIEPRAFVALFVYDNFDYIDSPTGEKNAIRIGPQDLRRWKLLFAGEFVAISMAKQGKARGATLSCADHTNYWDFIKQHYINFTNAGVELFESAFLGVKQDRLKFFDVLTAGAESKLYIWLTQSKNKDGNASLYLGIQRMLREMFFSVNDFYAEMFNRLRIGDSIVGLQEDETAAKLFQLQFFEKFIKNQVGGQGGMVTARQLVDGLLGPVFHTYVTVACPRFDRKGESLGFRPEPASEISKGIINRDGSWPGASLNYTVIKPDTWFMTPPMCNVIFPHMYRSISFGRNYLAEPTRMFLRTSLLFTGQDKWLTERFYAPDFKTFNDLLYKEGGYLERLAGTTLPHEKFVGLNPAMVWQNDLPAYVAKGPRREYLSQLTHYLFWKYKFGTRTVNCSGPLNLDIVPAYPGLVMDRVQTDVGVTRHFIGNISAVVHSVDQMGGWTHFSMTGARVHDEQVDFDDGGRSLEDVVAKGTDGFLDPRYESERIGPDVYQKLFGCDSIVDILDESERWGTEIKEVRVPTRSLTAAEQEEIARIEREYHELIAILDADRAAGGGDVPFVDDEFAFILDPTRQLPTGGYADELLGLSESTSAFLNEYDTPEYRQRLRETADAQILEVRNRATALEDREVPVKLDLVPVSVAKIHGLYKEIAKQGGNLHLFSKGLTNRPKATFPEMMGTDLANVPPARNEVGDGTSNGSIENMHVQDPSLLLYDGFFAGAVNPAARTTKDNQYFSHVTETRRERQTVETEVLLNIQVLDVTTGQFETPYTETETEIISTLVGGEQVNASYPLKEHLEERREKIKAYVDSLVHRGMRG